MGKTIFTRTILVLFLVSFAGLVTPGYANRGIEKTDDFTVSGVIDPNDLLQTPPASGPVTGRITDSYNSPMQGVSVVVAGTTNGASTDSEGNFRLNNVPRNGQLEISFVGYGTRTINVDGRSHITVSLSEDTEILDEVVVIGYGSVKRSDLTGSVSSVGSDALSSKGTSSVLGALQGAAPGVDIVQNSTRPGSGFTIKVRGESSLNASGNPLYVVDGIILDEIDFLNPSDIEQIDILKDASSTAIFGSRGSSGVVIIRTKGSSPTSSKLRVNYDGYFGVRELARIPDFMGGREWMEFRTSRYYAWDPDNEKWYLPESSKVSMHQNSPMILNNLYNESYTDWLDLATQGGRQQNHYLSISGSGSGISYNLGVGYQDERGNFKKEDMQRYTIKGALTHKASDVFMAGVNFNMSHLVVNTGSQNGYRDFLRMLNFLDAYDKDGNIVRQPGTASSISGSGNYTSSGNPLLELESGDNIDKRFNVMASFFVEVTPLNGLSLKTTFAPRLNQRQRAYYYGLTAERSSAVAQNQQRTFFEWTWDNQITYAQKFDRHNLTATGIVSLNKGTVEMMQIQGQNFPFNSQWYNIFTGTLVNSGLSAVYQQEQLASFTGRVNYDYNSKYYFTGTIRYDGDSKLAPGHKWEVFPSMALAWRMSDEEWMKGTSSWLSNLKWRLSYGLSGNNASGNVYGTMQTPNTGSISHYDFGGSATTGFPTNVPANQDLSWEKARELNLGIDFGLLDNRITGTIDIYDKLSKDLIMSRNLALESGVTSMIANIGKVSNRGIELALTTRNIQTRDWNWTTSFSFSANRNEVKELFGTSDDLVGNGWFLGQPISVIFDYKVTGVWSDAEWRALSKEERTAYGATYPGYAKAHNTNWLAKRTGKAGNDKIDSDDRMILGSPYPDWTGGLTSTLRYKNLDFSFNIYTRQGMMVLDNFLGEFGTSGNDSRGRTKVSEKYYVPPGALRPDWDNWEMVDGKPYFGWKMSEEVADGAIALQSYTGSFMGNNGRYQDSSFIKVRNITLGYTLPQQWLKKARLSSARVYVNVLNPFTFTDYVGWDPEYATTGLTNGNGPSSVTYQFGLNLSF